MNGKYIIEARNVYYNYSDGTPALNGVNLKIVTGQKVAVLGANGAGKSTLFLHFNGIIRPSHGKILFNGKELNYGHRPLLELRKNIGLVFQDPDDQLFSASVIQDVAFGPLNLGREKAEALASSRAAMEETEVVEVAQKPTHLLSHGQKKRVSIAGVLAMNPLVIVFDEPTACLDPRMADKIIELINKLNRQGKTIIMSTHDVDLAFDWADYVILLRNGTVAGEGKPQDVFLQSTLIDTCGLKTPWVFDIYRQLQQIGMFAPELPVPTNKDILFEMIKNCAMLYKPKRKTAGV